MKRMIATAFAVFIFGCGGGDESAPPPVGAVPVPAPVAVATPQGFYQGTISDLASGGYDNVTYVILENGTIWGLYSEYRAEAGGLGSFRSRGVLHASGSFNNGSYSAPDARNYRFNEWSAVGPLNVSYNVAGFTGTVPNSSGGLVSFTGHSPRESGYNYNTSAKLSDLVGFRSSGGTLSPSGAVLTPPIKMTIGADGSLSGSRDACTFLGKLSPRSSGKNVYDVSARFGTGPTCAAQGLHDTQTNGIAYTKFTDRIELTIIVQNQQRTRAWKFYP